MIKILRFHKHGIKTISTENSEFALEIWNDKGCKKILRKKNVVVPSVVCIYIHIYMKGILQNIHWAYLPIFHVN